MATKILQLVLLLSISILCSSSAELKYPAAFNFGDSNSDPGNMVAGLGYSLPPPYGEAYFGNDTGRYSDGRLIVDFLTNAMDLPFLDAYLESVRMPNFHTGCNFAASAATITPATRSSICPFSFGIQVSQFLRLKAQVINLLSQSEEFSKYLPAEDYFYKGLYMFDIGQNDISFAFDSMSYDEVVASIPGYLAEFEAGIQRLYNVGARNFWIHNTGPLGCLPQHIVNFETAKTKLDEFGCVKPHNQAATVFNQQLHDLCQKLKGQYADMNITYVDIFAIKLDLIRNYSQYGFVQPIMACCGYGDPPLNYDTQVGCGKTVVLNGTSVTAKGCIDSTKYVNWDGIHYTEAANRHVASQILTGKYTKSCIFG